MAAGDADAAALDDAAVAAARAHLAAQGPAGDGGAAAAGGLRRDARTLAIGDGGNEVGWPRRCCAAWRRSAGGADFVALSANGCYRACDALLLGTEQLGGDRLELGAHVDRPPADPDADCIGALRRRGRTLADLEAHVLAQIMAPAVGAVDGAHHERPLSVDGMPFEPHHRAPCDRLWEIAGSRARARDSEFVSSDARSRSHVLHARPPRRELYPTSTPTTPPTPTPTPTPTEL